MWLSTSQAVELLLARSRLALDARALVQLVEAAAERDGGDEGQRVQPREGQHLLLHLWNTRKISLLDEYPESIENTSSF